MRGKTSIELIKLRGESCEIFIDEKEFWKLCKRYEASKQGRLN